MCWNCGLEEFSPLQYLTCRYQINLRGRLNHINRDPIKYLIWKEHSGPCSPIKSVPFLNSSYLFFTYLNQIYACVQGGSQICFHVHFTTNISIYGLLCISVKNWCTAIKMPFCISAQSTFHRFNKLKTGTNTLLYKLNWRL